LPEPVPIGEGTFEDSFFFQDSFFSRGSRGFPFSLCFIGRGCSAKSMSIERFGGIVGEGGEEVASGITMSAIVGDDECCGDFGLRALKE